MAYKKEGEPEFNCLKCNKIYGVSDNNLLYGLFRDGQLMRCNKCFEELKHNFWLELMEQNT